jgi:hypothetical protein
MMKFLEITQSMFPWMLRPQSVYAGLDLTPFMLIGAVSGLLLVLVPLYFLIARKQAFEKSVAHAS